MERAARVGGSKRKRERREEREVRKFMEFGKGEESKGYKGEGAVRVREGRIRG